MPKSSSNNKDALAAIKSVHDERKKEYAALLKTYNEQMQEIQKAWAGIQSLHNAAHEIQGTEPDGSCPFGGLNRAPPGRTDTRLVVLEVLDAAADEDQSKLSAVQVHDRCIARGWDHRNSATPKGAIRQQLRRLANEEEIKREKNTKNTTVYWSEA